MLSLATLLIVLALLSMVALLYPYLIYPLLLRMLPRWPVTPQIDRQDARDFSCAMLMCAHNEEESLPAKIRNLRMLKRELPHLEILAYSDCSTDATNQMLSEAADILEPVFGSRRAGKVLGMQQLVSKTDADIIVFTDANVIIESGSLRRLIEYFADPTIGAVAATLVYDRNAGSNKSVTASVGGLYWRLEESIKQLETRSGSTMGADGSLFARRRRNYPCIPADLVDDMAVSLSVLFGGLRCISASDVIGYETSVAHREEEFRRKRRIACGSYSTYRFMRREIARLGRVDRFKFFSHKVLRWWGAFFLLAFIVFLFAGLFTAGVGVPGSVAIILLGALFAGLGRSNVALFGPAYEIVLAIIATGIGIIESMFGRKYKIWDPSRNR